MKVKTEWITGAEFARRMNCSRAAITQAFNKGLVKRNARKQYLWPLVQEQYLAHVDVGQQRPFRMSWR